MKIRAVELNNRKKVFVVRTWRGQYDFPFAKALPLPLANDPIVTVAVDPELATEGFTYRLASGQEGSVLIDQVLDYNQDPAFMRDMLLYKLTLEAKRQVAASPLAKREIIRRLGTSPTQFYRLLDPTNRRKTIDKMLELLHVLECEVELVIKS